MIWQVVFWHWWALGALLLIVELLVPGMYFLWMAEAATVTGVLLLLFPNLDFAYQVIAFSLLSVISIGVFRKFLKKHPIASDQPFLNQRVAGYMGRVFTLEQAIVHGEGKIRIEDSFWKIRGEDCEVGSKVKIVSAEGHTLIVERVPRN